MSTTVTTKKTPSQRKSEALEKDADLVVRTEHRQLSKDEAVTYALVGSAIATVVGVLSYFGWKADKAKQAKLNEEHAVRLAAAEARADEMQAWFDTQRRDGKIVIETIDGEYMAIPAQAYAESEIVTKEV